MNRREIRMPTTVKQLLDGLCESIRQRLHSDRAQVCIQVPVELHEKKSVTD